MEKKSERKRQMILSRAKEVFIRKGYTGVTMKDIIEECKISRGGLYVYFSSVEEIFKEVVSLHNKSKIDTITLEIQQGITFKEIIDEYFDKQKKRLLNMNISLKTAMMEFCLEYKDDYSKSFISSQFYNSKKLMIKILQYGLGEENKNEINLEMMAENIMFFIEGISTLAVLSDLSPIDIDNQFQYIKQNIFLFFEMK